MFSIARFFTHLLPPLLAWSLLSACGSTPGVLGEPDAADTAAETQADAVSDENQGEPGTGSDSTAGETSAAAAGLLRVKVFTESLGAEARVEPSAQDAPDDVDVNLTPTAYTIAFKRLVLKQVDEATEEVLAEVELLSASAVDDALVVDLENASAEDLVDVASLPAGTYNQIDIEVFYLDMTVATLYPGSTSHDIQYRMVYDTIGVLEPRDFLLYLEPEWMTGGDELAAAVTVADWYWMEMGNPDHVVAVTGAAAHPDFPVLDLFANDAFWSQEHRVLEGGLIEPPLVYDPNEGGVVTITIDVTETFNFKDYHDESVAADGLWEIRLDAGIHPFPPRLNGLPELPEAAERAP